MRPLQLTDRVYLVGSGHAGFGISHELDCHVYLVDGGTELALIDAGVGLGTHRILENISLAGFSPSRIRHLLLTHGHGDHAGGAGELRQTGMAVYASKTIADALGRGDEAQFSVDAARSAGQYPPDYRLAPCPVDAGLEDGQSLVVGELALTVIDTPGHCDGHVSFLLREDGQHTLFAGDAVFFGGRVVLQNIHDCRVSEQADSLRRLRSERIDVLLPGHMMLALSGGSRHIEQANRYLDELGVPPQLAE